MTIEIDGRKMLTVKEVAEKLCVSERTVRKWIAERKMGAYKIGHRVYIAKEDLEKFIQRI